MNSLSIENFLFVDDLELSQYRILAKLKNYSVSIQGEGLFPALKELAQLSSQLKQIKRKNIRMVDHFPIPVKRIDIENRCIEFDYFTLYESDINKILDLVKWGIPVIDEVIDNAISVKKAAIAVIEGNPVTTA